MLHLHVARGNWLIHRDPACDWQLKKGKFIWARFEIGYNGCAEHHAVWKKKWQILDVCVISQQKPIA